MTTAIIKGTEVTRPDTTPLTSTVLDHATVKTLEAFGWSNNEGLFPSYNCLDTSIPSEYCPPAAEDAGGPAPESVKLFANGAWQPAFEFAIHGAVQCSPVGLDEADQEREVARVFEQNEGRGVEQAILANRFVANAPLWTAPTVLTPGTAIDVRIALAVLEGHAAYHYAGVPTLHLPRAAASLLGERLVERDGKFFTRLGSKVVIGGGYDQEGAPDGTWDLWATGEVYVEKSTQLDINSYVIPGDGNDPSSGGTGLADNTVLTLAEKMFRVAVDCYASKVTATVWS